MLDTSPILHDLAARIREEHDAAEAAKGAAVVVARKGIEHALTAGELLLEAKAQVPHGQWLPWLAENCPAVSPRMAQYYMGLARKRPELESNYETVSHLTLREAVQLLEEDEGEDESEDEVERFRRRFASVGSVVIVKAPDNSSHRQMTVIVELVSRQQSGERRAT